MGHYTTVGIELVVGFFVLFTATKILGKTQLSQITPFDFISALILGELVGNAVYDHGTQLVEIVYTTTVWSALILIVEFITQKYKVTRKFFEGEPNIVIHKGLIKYKTLKKAKLDINQLQSLIRQQGIFSLQEVEYAILETNGMISVLPKAQFTQPTKQEMQLPIQQPVLPITIIIDGEIIYDNLKEAELDEEWLYQELEKKEINHISEILYAEWRSDTSLYLVKF